jgi:hypothetical protein
MASTITFSTSTTTYGTATETYGSSTAPLASESSNDNLLRMMQVMSAQMEVMNKKTQEQALQILGLQNDLKAEKMANADLEERTVAIIEAKALGTLLSIKFTADELSRTQDELITRLVLLEACLGIQKEALDPKHPQSTTRAPNNSPRHNPEVNIHARSGSRLNPEEQKRPSNPIDPTYYEDVNFNYFTRDAERFRIASDFTSSHSTKTTCSTTSSSGISSSSSSSSSGRTNNERAALDISSSSSTTSYYSSSSSSGIISSSSSSNLPSSNPFDDTENVQPPSTTSSSSGTSSSSSSLQNLSLEYR